MRYTLTTKIGDLDLAAPAVRALEGAHYARLGQLAGESVEKLEKLHGLGSNALNQLRSALASCGMALEGEIIPKPKNGAYIQVGALKMYYQIEGTGIPLVLLHGGMLQSGVFSAIQPILAEKHRVITIDQQAHGRTADTDKELDFAKMADDTAELLKKIKVDQADFFGYSEGGVVALELAIRHPKLVRKLVVSSAVYQMDGYKLPVRTGMKIMTDKIVPKRMRLYYQAVAPHPDAWPMLVKKSAELARTWHGIPKTKLKALKVPALVLMADKDYVREDHGKDLANLLKAEYVVLPKSSHMSYLFSPKKLLSTLLPFLDSDAEQ